MTNTERASDTAPRRVVVYTDGGCDPNPGPGGWGAVLIFGDHRRELSGGFRLTTNNRMEILAAIEALEALKWPCDVVLHSDSRYVVDAMSKGWVQKWKSQGWMRTRRDPALNADLWERLDELCQRHDVDFRWVKGHSGVPENERCDELATRALRGDDLEPDEVYEAAAGARETGSLWASLETPEPPPPPREPPRRARPDPPETESHGGLRITSTRSAAARQPDAGKAPPAGPPIPSSRLESPAGRATDEVARFGMERPIPVTPAQAGVHGQRQVSTPLDSRLRGNDGLCRGPAPAGPRASREGDPCRECGTPLERRIPRSSPRKQKAYRYAYYFLCPGCKRMFMPPEAIVTD